MGAAALTAGSLIAKAIGALYRIPLTNILGAEGLGLYQTVFPLYALLLSLSTSGIPSAVCSVTATHFKERGTEGANEVKREAMRLLKKIGFVASFLPALLCVPLSALLNAPDLWLSSRNGENDADSNFSDSGASGEGRNILASCLRSATQYHPCGYSGDCLHCTFGACRPAYTCGYFTQTAC